MRGVLPPSALADALRSLGLGAGDTVMVHASLSKVGDWIMGDARAVIDALVAVVGETGTIAMPAHTSDNSEPSEWMSPPVPEAWWPLIRAEMPPYHPDLSMTRKMGVLAETFRRYPGVRRSAHPQVSLSAWGKHSAWLTANHLLTDAIGETSPYARLLQLDASVLLIGVDHRNNTVLHVAEHRADWPTKTRKTFGAAITVNGERKWVTFDDLEEQSDDFAQIGAAYEAHIGYVHGKFGQADARLLKLRPLVDFAVTWINENRR